LVCDHPLPQRFGFLPGIADVSTKVEGSFDLVVSLDCSDPGRMGEAGTISRVDSVPLINIDHHVTNLFFGTVNLVDVNAVSTTQIVHQLALALGVSIDKDIAFCLLTGLVTDTRGFRTSNVGPDVLEIAVQLMEAGASLEVITRNGLDRRSFSALRLWGEALARAQIEGGLIWTSLPLKVRRSVDNGRRSDIGLSSLLLTAEEAEVAAVFIELEDGRVEVGFRAMPGLDVSALALSLGGGGHALASGCIVSGPLEEAQERVLVALRQDIAQQRRQALADG
jgi:phosphoesterase RecJ-like protein